MPSPSPRKGRKRPPLMPLCIRLSAILTLIVLALVSPAAHAGPPGPAHYRTGAYITAIHSFNIPEGTFDVDLWLWTIGLDPKRQPLQTMEFVDADKVVGSLDATLPRGKSFYRIRKVAATIRHHWDLGNFPFDRQTLEVKMEEATDDTIALVYDPDIASTALSPDVHLQDWRITGFRAVGGMTHYSTTFGDPNLKPGSGDDYTRLSLFVTMKRTSYTGLFKLTAAGYAAFALAFISFFLNPDVPTLLSGRMSLLAGSLFATVISMRSASAALASDNGLTLVDKIHIAILVYILVGTAMAVLIRLHLDKGSALEAVKRHSGRVCVFFTFAFVAANALLIAQAAAAG